MPHITALRKLAVKDLRKEATIVALRRVLDPLVELMFDAGVTVREFNQLMRERAVRSAAARVSRDLGRGSKSRVAIVTGLPRAEVARILRSDEVPSNSRLGQHPARRVLAGWFDNPRFLAPNGDPAVLPIFGKKRSFEQLVAMHSGGIPVRAMLDELTQIDAVERLADQRVKAKARIPILAGPSGGAIEAIGERTRDLLETLLYNLRHRAKPLFEGTVFVDQTDYELVSLLRREIAEQGTNFISATNSLFGRYRAKQNRPLGKPPSKCRLGVTVYYFQDNIDGGKDSGPDIENTRRKNLRRQRSPEDRRHTVGVQSRSRGKLQL
jgi:hypothetical protein